MFNKKTIAIFLIFWQFSCVNNLQDLASREQELKERHTFNGYLALEYLQYSRDLANKYNWRDSDYFSRKGIKAAHNQDIFPEVPEEWYLDNSQIEQATLAREKLIKLLYNFKAILRKLFFNFFLSSQANMLSFYYWLTCFDSTYVNISDSLSVVINNGSSSAVVISYRNGLYNWSGLQVYRLADYLPLSNQMSVSFIVNNSNARNFTEAAVDRFRVDEYEVLTNIDRTIVKEEPDFMIFPNPFSETFVLKLNNADFSTNFKITVHDISGRLVETHLNNDFSEQIQLGQNWNPGIYFISYKNKTQKVVKFK